MSEDGIVWLQAREIDMNVPGLRSGGPRPPKPGTHTSKPVNPDVGEVDVKINSLPEEPIDRLEEAVLSNRRVLWAIFWTGFLGTGALVWIGVELHATRLAKERAANIVELTAKEAPDALDHR